MAKPSKRGGLAVSIGVAVIGAIVAIALFGSPVYRIGAFDVRLSIAPSFFGETRISVPPLGEIKAKTHKAPIALQARVDNANIEDLHGVLVGRTGGRDIISQAKDDARSAAVRFVLRLLLLSFLGGTGAVLLLRVGRSPRRVVIAGATSTAMIAVLMALTAATYNAGAFEKPELTGTLRTAPWVLSLAKKGVIKLGQADEMIRNAATDISKLAGVGTGSADLSDKMKILVISDIHNNPIAIGYAKSLAEQVGADLVLDAGDLTDLGSQFESGLIKQFGDFGRPHVFVSGNHDSAQTIATLRGVRNTFLPDEKIVTVEGVRILGQNDPTISAHNERSFAATSGQISKAAKRLNKALRESSERPDIIMVHEPIIAQKFLGKAPIVVSGHDHTLAISSGGGTVWVRPGSTGASGVRYFTDRGGKSMTAIILYVTRPPSVRAVAVDMIAITSPNGEFTITRKRLK